MNLSGNLSSCCSFPRADLAAKNLGVAPGRCVHYLVSEFAQASSHNSAGSSGEVIFLCAEPCMEAGSAMALFGEAISNTEYPCRSHDLSVIPTGNCVAELRRIARKYEKSSCYLNKADSNDAESVSCSVKECVSSAEDPDVSVTDAADAPGRLEAGNDFPVDDEFKESYPRSDTGTIKPSSSPVVLLQNVPPADESETASEARALLRMVRAGCFVVVSIMPEGIQLFESFESLSPHCVCLRSADLLQNFDGGDAGLVFGGGRLAPTNFWPCSGLGAKDKRDPSQSSLRHQLAIPMLANAFRDYARGNHHFQPFLTPGGLARDGGTDAGLSTSAGGGVEGVGLANEKGFAGVSDFASEEKLPDSEVFSLAGTAEVWPQAFALDFGSSLRYATALSSLVSTSLRDTLMDEERELRFAMFLLGDGSFSDLERIVSQKSLEIVQGLAIDAPQFGVDLRLDKFRCAGFEDSRSIGIAFRVIEEFGDVFPNVLLRATECLLGRADSKRAAQLLPMIHNRADRTSLESRYAANLFDGGELALLRDAKRAVKNGYVTGGREGQATPAKADGPSSFDKDDLARDDCAGQAEAQGAAGLRREPGCPREAGRLESEPERLLEVLKDGVNKGTSTLASAGMEGVALSDAVARCRGLLEGKALETRVELPAAHSFESIAADADGPWVASLLAWPLVESWASLCEGVRLALLGDFPASYQALVALRARIDNGVSGMFESALAVAYYLAAGMLGALTPQDGARLLEAQRFFGERGLSLGRALCEAAPEFASLLMGNAARANGIERLAHRCQRLGLHALLAWCLLAEAIEDLRTGVTVRALVRAKTARSEFLSMGACVAGYQTDILCEAVATCLGEAAEAPCALQGPRKLTSSARDVRECLDLVVASRSAIHGSLDETKDGDEMSEQVPSGNSNDSLVNEHRSWKTPRSSMWLVNVLSGDCGELSVAFERAMPDAWKRALAHMTCGNAWEIPVPVMPDATAAAAVEKGDGANAARAPIPANAGEGAETAPAGANEKRSDFATGLAADSDASAGLPVSQSLANWDGRDSATAIAGPTIETAHRGSVEIHLLGGLCVKVNGRELDTRVLERRRAKSLLMLLATIPDHQIRRYAAIESVWPELDYASGTQRLYEATSVIRTRISKKGGKTLRPILTNRAAHSLSLNPDCVAVDVDRFVEIAHRALASEGNDRLVVSLCRQVEGFYRGDLEVPTEDGLGTATKRRSQLQSLFIDCMVAGSLAALRLGRRLAAARFARRAYALQDTREDVMACFVRSLCATGRSAEAEHEYRKFAVRMVDMHRRPPSRMLRKLARELFGIVTYEDDQSSAQVEELGMGPNGESNAGASGKGDAAENKRPAGRGSAEMRPVEKRPVEKSNQVPAVDEDMAGSPKTSWAKEG